MPTPAMAGGKRGLEGMYVFLPSQRNGFAFGDLRDIKSHQWRRFDEGQWLRDGTVVAARWPEESAGEWLRKSECGKYEILV